MLIKFFLFQKNLNKSEISSQIYWSSYYEIFSNKTAFSESLILSLIPEMRRISASILISGLSSSQTNINGEITSNCVRLSYDKNTINS